MRAQIRLVLYIVFLAWLPGLAFALTPYGEGPKSPPDAHSFSLSDLKDGKYINSRFTGTQPYSSHQASKECMSLFAGVVGCKPSPSNCLPPCEQDERCVAATGSSMISLEDGDVWCDYYDHLPTQISDKQWDGAKYFDCIRCVSTVILSRVTPKTKANSKSATAALGASASGASSSSAPTGSMPSITTTKKSKPPTLQKP